MSEREQAGSGAWLLTLPSHQEGKAIVRDGKWTMMLLDVEEKAILSGQGEKAVASEAEVKVI